MLDLNIMLDIIAPRPSVRHRLLSSVRFCRSSLIRAANRIVVGEDPFGQFEL